MDEYVYPHKLSLLGQTAIDFGLDYVIEHNRRVDEHEAKRVADSAKGDDNG